MCATQTVSDRHWQHVRYNGAEAEGMPYCPQCLTEHVEGSNECVGCHVALRAGAPPERTLESAESGASDVKLVRVRTFTSPTAYMYAELAKGILEAEGIPCVLPGLFSATAYLGVDVVQLLVRKEDAIAAVEILENFFDHSQGTALTEKLHGR